MGNRGELTGRFVLCVWFVGTMVSGKFDEDINRISMDARCFTTLKVDEYVINLFCREMDSAAVFV